MEPVCCEKGQPPPPPPQPSSSPSPSPPLSSSSSSSVSSSASSFYFQSVGKVQTYCKVLGQNSFCMAGNARFSIAATAVETSDAIRARKSWAIILVVAGVISSERSQQNISQQAIYICTSLDILGTPTYVILNIPKPYAQKTLTTDCRYFHGAHNGGNLIFVDRTVPRNN